ncbi:alpha/beta fold hydrolase [Isoptericola sp. b441]|uniref:Alpha/beta fold hydrolase n=1 Tax=Actinotalea lenta TaxID=3064654 RepID=A0ABT9D734_9CELL|nr:alpha/beta fold hydrolase [Isoptericola sp. b441]MDO8106345.1 alpha/beta fold hydrolase [Isoptericola sp. b441]
MTTSATHPVPVVTEVRIPGPAGDLAATLQLPAGPGPHPAALLITGSGPIDRNSDHRRMAMGATRQVAQALADVGVASLRYDKRGIGGSDGDYLSTGFGDATADARAALAWLSALPEVGPVVVIGHSEGALHAQSLAADGDVVGAVLLAGQARPGRDLLEWQGAQVAASLTGLTARLVRLLRIDLLAKQRAALDKAAATTSDVARVGGRRSNARWLREYLSYDPRPTLARIDVPVLAITGEKDLQVPAEDLDAIAATVPGPVETLRPADLTHILRRDVGRPSLQAYKKLVAQPVDAEVLAAVTEWVARVVGEH